MFLKEMLHLLLFITSSFTCVWCQVCYEKADVMFLIDGSDSILPAEFDDQKHVMLMFAKRRAAPPFDVRVGARVYSSYSDVSPSIDLVRASEITPELVDLLVQPKHGSQLHFGMENVRNTMQTKGRQHEAQIAVIFSDGREENHTATRQLAEDMKQAGIYIITVGVGRNINKSQLEALASVYSDYRYINPKGDLVDSILRITTLIGTKWCAPLTTTHVPPFGVNQLYNEQVPPGLYSQSMDTSPTSAGSVNANQQLNVQNQVSVQDRTIQSTQTRTGNINNGISSTMQQLGMIMQDQNNKLTRQESVAVNKDNSALQNMLQQTAFKVDSVRNSNTLNDPLQQVNNIEIRGNNNQVTGNEQDSQNMFTQNIRNDQSISTQGSMHTLPIQNSMQTTLNSNHGNSMNIHSKTLQQEFSQSEQSVTQNNQNSLKVQPNNEAEVHVLLQVPSPQQNQQGSEIVQSNQQITNEVQANAFNNIITDYTVTTPTAGTTTQIQPQTTTRRRSIIELVQKLIEMQKRLQRTIDESPASANKIVYNNGLSPKQLTGTSFDTILAASSAFAHQMNKDPPTTVIQNMNPAYELLGTTPLTPIAQPPYDLPEITTVSNQLQRNQMTSNVHASQQNDVQSSLDTMIDRTLSGNYDATEQNFNMNNANAIVQDQGQTANQETQNIMDVASQTHSSQITADQTIGTTFDIAQRNTNVKFDNIHRGTALSGESTIHNIQQLDQTLSTSNNEGKQVFGTSNKPQTVAVNQQIGVSKENDVSVQSRTQSVTSNTQTMTNMQQLPPATQSPILLDNEGATTHSSSRMAGNVQDNKDAYTDQAVASGMVANVKENLASTQYQQQPSEMPLPSVPAGTTDITAEATSQLAGTLQDLNKVLIDQTTDQVQTFSSQTLESQQTTLPTGTETVTSVLPGQVSGVLHTTSSQQEIHKSVQTTENMDIPMTTTISVADSVVNQPQKEQQSQSSDLVNVTSNQVKIDSQKDVISGSTSNEIKKDESINQLINVLEKTSAIITEEIRKAEGTNIPVDTVTVTTENMQLASQDLKSTDPTSPQFQTDVSNTGLQSTLPLSTESDLTGQQSTVQQLMQQSTLNEEQTKQTSSATDALHQGQAQPQNQLSSQQQNLINTFITINSQQQTEEQARYTLKILTDAIAQAQRQRMYPSAQKSQQQSEVNAVDLIGGNSSQSASQTLQTIADALALLSKSDGSIPPAQVPPPSQMQNAVETTIQQKEDSFNSTDTHLKTIAITGTNDHQSISNINIEHTGNLNPESNKNLQSAIDTKSKTQLDVQIQKMDSNVSIESSAPKYETLNADKTHISLGPQQQSSTVSDQQVVKQTNIEATTEKVNNEKSQQNEGKPIHTNLGPSPTSNQEIVEPQKQVDFVWAQSLSQLTPKAGQKPYQISTPNDQTDPSFGQFGASLSQLRSDVHQSQGQDTLYQYNQNQAPSQLPFDFQELPPLYQFDTNNQFLQNTDNVVIETMSGGGGLSAQGNQDLRQDFTSQQSLPTTNTLFIPNNIGNEPIVDSNIGINLQSNPQQVSIQQDVSIQSDIREGSQQNQQVMVNNLAQNANIMDNVGSGIPISNNLFSESQGLGERTTVGSPNTDMNGHLNQISNQQSVDNKVKNVVAIGRTNQPINNDIPGTDTVLNVALNGNQPADERHNTMRDTIGGQFTQFSTSNGSSTISQKVTNITTKQTSINDNTKVVQQNNVYQQALVSDVDGQVSTIGSTSDQNRIILGTNIGMHQGVSDSMDPNIGHGKIRIGSVQPVSTQTPEINALGITSKSTTGSQQSLASFLNGPPSQQESSGMIPTSNPTNPNAMSTFATKKPTENSIPTNSPSNNDQQVPQPVELAKTTPIDIQQMGNNQDKSLNQVQIGQTQQDLLKQSMTTTQWQQYRLSQEELRKQLQEMEAFHQNLNSKVIKPLRIQPFGDRQQVQLSQDINPQNLPQQQKELLQKIQQQQQQNIQTQSQETQVGTNVQQIGDSQQQKQQQQQQHHGQNTLQEQTQQQQAIKQQLNLQQILQNKQQNDTQTSVYEDQTFVPTHSIATNAMQSTVDVTVAENNTASQTTAKVAEQPKIHSTFLMSPAELSRISQFNQNSLTSVLTSDTNENMIPNGQNDQINVEQPPGQIDDIVGRQKNIPTHTSQKSTVTQNAEKVGAQTSIPTYTNEITTTVVTQNATETTPVSESTEPSASGISLNELLWGPNYEQRIQDFALERQRETEAAEAARQEQLRLEQQRHTTTRSQSFAGQPTTSRSSSTLPFELNTSFSQTSQVDLPSQPNKWRRLFDINYPLNVPQIGGGHTVGKSTNQHSSNLVTITTTSQTNYTTSQNVFNALEARQSSRTVTDAITSQMPQGTLQGNGESNGKQTSREFYDLCLGSQFVNRVAYNIAPSTCHEFVQCFYSKGSIHVEKASCPFRMHWDQELLLCRPSRPGSCNREPCLKPGVKGYNHGCRSYYSCENGQAVPKCCAVGFRYKNELEGCAMDSTCLGWCDVTVNEIYNKPFPTCRMIPFEQDSGFYFEEIPGVGMMPRMCADGSTFNAKKCACDIQVGKLDFETNQGTVTKGCKPEFILDLTEDFSDMSGNRLPLSHDRVVLEKGAAKFDGTGKITIWRFSGGTFGSEVGFTLRFKPIVDWLGAQRMDLLSNCDRDGPSVGISVTANATGGFVTFMAHTTDSGVSSFNIAYKGKDWNNVTYVYDGNHLTGSVNGVKLSVQMIGHISQRTSPISLGSCNYVNNYHGLMDDVRIYLCAPTWLL